MSERFFDLEWEQLDSGTVRLRQSAFDEDNVIDVHPEQILFIARRLCGLKQETAELAKDLERKLAVLDGKIADLVLNDGIRQEIVSRCGDGFEIILQMDGLLELSTEYTGGIQPAGCDTSAPKAEGHDLSREVTTSHDGKKGQLATPPQISHPANAAPPAHAAAGEQLGLAV